MEPTFDYPFPDSRHVFIKCEKDDPQREDFWCQVYGEWCAPSDGVPRSHIAHNCCQIWRKRVDVPEGWEIVPKGEPAGSPAQLIAGGKWQAAMGEHWLGGQLDFILIRPIQPAEKDPVYLTGEQFKAIHGIADAVPINPYAVTIKGVTFDVWDILTAYKVTNHAKAYAIKNLLTGGNIQEAKQSLERATELEAK